MLVSQYFVFIQQFHVISEARLIKLYSYTLLLNENFWDKIYVFLSISVHRTSVRFYFLVYSAWALVSYPVIVSFVLPEDMNTLDFFLKKEGHCWWHRGQHEHRSIYPDSCYFAQWISGRAHRHGAWKMQPLSYIVNALSSLHWGLVKGSVNTFLKLISCRQNLQKKSRRKVVLLCVVHGAKCIQLTLNSHSVWLSQQLDQARWAHLYWASQ